MNDFSYEDFQKILQKAFPFSVPEQFSYLDATAFSKIKQVLEKQAGRSIYQLNYAAVIEDYMEVIAPVLKEKLANKEAWTSDELNEFKSNNRQLFALVYLKEIQDINTSPWQKVELCFYLITFFTTAKEIYGCDFIDNQDDFLDKISGTKQYIEDNLRKAQAIALPERPISELWLYDANQLMNISDILYKNGFTETPQDFCWPFFNNSQKCCNWKKKVTELIFLFELLFGEKESFPTSYYSFISEKFTQKGSKITEGVVRTTCDRKLGTIKINAKNLKGNYLIIHSLHNQVFMK
jgi:hypothetical protein